MEVAEIKEAAILAGNIQHRLAGVAVDLELHVPPQRGAVVLEILCVHLRFSFDRD